MAANEKHTLDLSGAGIKKLEKRDGVGFQQLILDNNELTKLENLDCFPGVEKVSASGNAIIRMYGVSKCHHITHLNLPNNNIVTIEGLKEMPNLQFLNLSVNNLKIIQNLQFSNNLVHLDMSRNNIAAISDISNLTKLKVLHLNGNKIISLNRASTYLPTCICTLSLADNCIADLNEVSHLVKLHCLEQLTFSGNPCLSSEELSLPPFDYRPFIINWSLGLRLLDGGVATQKESLKAEWLYSQGKGRHYKPGEHMELIEYLCQVCPVTTADQSTEEEDEKLIRILHKQRQHKEQFLNEMSQAPPCEISESSRGPSNAMTQSYHFKTQTSPQKQEVDMSMSTSCIVPSKIMYESAPEVLFHPTPPEPTQNAPPSFQSGKYPRSVSKSEILHNSIKSPIVIEQVEVEASPKAKQTDATKSPYQFYDDRRVRPSSSTDVRPTHTPKGTLIRKVSKRATSPSTAAPPPGSRSRLPHSTSRSRISPSRSCILTARLSAAAKNSSESDTSEDTNRTPQRSFRSLSTDTQSGHNSPVLQHTYTSALSPTKRAFGLDSPAQSQLCSPKFGQGSPSIQKSKTMSEIYGKSEEDIAKAAIKIQSVWRGYFVRHHNVRVFKLLQEIRFRRLEDHIQHLHGHLCRLTDFVLRQQQDLQHERELRKLQAEDIRHLHEKAKDIQKSVTTALSKAKNNVLQNLSEQETTPNSDTKFDKHLPQQSSDSRNLALRFSTQMYQENSNMYSPSSQTSSVTSSVPDTSFNRSKSRRELQPSASDASDADSGLQSMVSPNVAAGDYDRHGSDHVDHATMNGYGNETPSGDYHRRNSSNKFNSERELPFDDPALQAKILQQTKSLASARHAMPMAAIPSVGEGGYMHPSHLPNLNHVRLDKNSMPLSKTNYVEYPNSSVENSPCSLSGEPYVFSKQQAYSNIVSNPSCPLKPEDASKWKNSGLSNGCAVDPSQGKDNGFPEIPLGCCSKSCMSHQIKDKVQGHHTRCSKPCLQNAYKHLENSEAACNLKNCAVLPKRLNQLAQNKIMSPMEDKDSPSSPCTVEMSGCISHSCSFQSDGFAAEELSATATVKLFSTRAVSMTCANGTMSPQTNAPRPLTLSDASPQANLRSPLVLAASVWEKKVQDIESTFHQLQTQIRDLEGAFGQIGQFGQFFYPGILQEETKESRPAIHCAEPTPGALVLDMPKINFKRAESGNDRLFQTCFPGGVPYLPQSSSQQQQAANQNLNDCRVEEIEQDFQPLQEESESVSNPSGDIQEAKS